MTQTPQRPQINIDNFAPNHKTRLVMNVPPEPRQEAKTVKKRIFPFGAVVL